MTVRRQRRLALLVAGGLFLPAGCAHRRDGEFVDLDELAARKGKNVRVTLLDERGRRVGLTLELVRFDKERVEGRLVRSEVESGGVWYAAPSTQKGEMIAIPVDDIEELRVRDPEAAIVGTASCLMVASTAALVLLFIAAAGAGSGRPFREGGRNRIPALAVFDSRRGRRKGAAAREREEAALASGWVAAGQAEAASVPAFERLAAELRCAGAPDGLIDASLDAAAEERTHAAFCFDAAAAWTGASYEALPLVPTARVEGPERMLATLAREAWEDGCLHEGTAAAHVSAVASRAREPAVRDRLLRIAEEERSHAELGWQILSWCWNRGTGETRELIASFESGPNPPPTRSLDESLDQEWLARNGHLDATAWSGASERARERSLQRLRRLTSTGRERSSLTEESE